MSTLFWGQNRSITSVDSNAVRQTTDPVTPDAPAAEMAGPPEFNEVETDLNPHNGLATRQVASDWHASEKYVPGWASYANPTSSFAAINQQVDSSGTAAAREMMGQQGHGTMAYAVGIEPVIRSGAQFGADYFAVDPRVIQETGGDYMSPAPGLDRDSVSASANKAVQNAKDAGAAGQYAAWYAALQTGY